MGVKVEILGNPSDHKPLVLVGNHCSYLDILFWLSITSLLCLPKSIKGWFVFGLLASLQNSIFIDRRNLKVFDSLNRVTQNLSANFATIIFPEGTTNNGRKY